MPVKYKVMKERPSVKKQLELQGKFGLLGKIYISKTFEDVETCTYLTKGTMLGFWCPTAKYSRHAAEIAPARITHMHNIMRDDTKECLGFDVRIEFHWTRFIRLTRNPKEANCKLMPDSSIRMLKDVTGTRTRPKRLTCLFQGWQLLDSTKLPQHPENEVAVVQPLPEIPIPMPATPVLTPQPPPQLSPEQEQELDLKLDNTLEQSKEQEKITFSMDLSLSLSDDEESDNCFKLPCMCDSLSCEECGMYMKGLTSSGQEASCVLPDVWESNPMISPLMDETAFTKRLNTYSPQLVVGF